LETRINHYFRYLKQKLSEASNRLIDPRRRIEDSRLRLDDLTVRLNRILRQGILRKREKYEFWDDRLSANNPIYLFENIKIRLKQNKNNLFKTFEIYNRSNQIKIRELTAKLQALSPVAILTRGYSITRTIPGQTVVKDPRTVSLNQDLEIMVALGRLYCRVKGKSTDG
jgi:exodeoxyribonuclease VII large subunit